MSVWQDLGNVSLDRETSRRIKDSLLTGSLEDLDMATLVSANRISLVGSAGRFILPTNSELKSRVKNLRDLGIKVPRNSRSLGQYELTSYLGAIHRETCRLIQDHNHTLYGPLFSGRAE